ncbi:MAG: lipoyl(octanoyl) transferase [Polaribacter sp.]|jgi:lipoyl(octanoyl) transferase
MNQLNHQCIFKQLGRQDYQPIWQKMKDFTINRDDTTQDEVWFVEHSPVFTQGQAGKEEHLLSTKDIPVVKVDRGGQVTYHGPGQQVVYFLVDLRRKKMGVRHLVSAIEDIVIELLAGFKIKSSARADAPGVYVDGKKICSLGLKIKRGCSFHGLALNVNMDLEPFSRINPCGYQGLQVTQTSSLGGPLGLAEVEKSIKPIIMGYLNYNHSSDANVRK